jgi:peptidoglycan/xylan/chitin deacetylase (PgdA/CDA1 family)
MNIFHIMIRGVFHLFKKLFFILVAVVVLIAVPFSASAKVTQRIELPVIMYHHILKSPDRWGAYVVSPETLEGDLQYLQDNGYTTIGIADLIAYTDGRQTLPEKPVMLTFDDGQASVAEYALPLLEKYNMCAVLFIVGSYTDTYTENGDHNINYSYLTWPDLKRLKELPQIELGVHTYAMHSTDAGRQGCQIGCGEDAEMYKQVFSDDLDMVEKRFATYLNFQPQAFAYPFGLYCDEAVDVLRQHGYQVVFTCEEHVNCLSGDPDELLRLGRYNRPNDMERDKFFARLCIE